MNKWQDVVKMTSTANRLILKHSERVRLKQQIKRDVCTMFRL